MRPVRRRRRLLSLVGLLLLVGVVGISTASVTTRQGVNFHVSTKRIPLFVKTIDFLHRHYQYRLLTQEIVGGVRSDEDRVLAVFHWTREHIRPAPQGWPVIDDHVLHIIIRGYGTSDQVADVFTTLSTYAGVPAFWKVLRAPGAKYDVIFSFAKMNGRWVVFDVWNGFVFKDQTGTLTSATDLARDPALVRAIAGHFVVGDVPYVDYFPLLASLQVPRTLRAQLQMPGPRLWYEVRRITKAEGHHGS